MKLTVKDIQGKDQGELEVKIPLIENGKATQAVHAFGCNKTANQNQIYFAPKTRLIEYEDVGNQRFVETGISGQEP